MKNIKYGQLPWSLKYKLVMDAMFEKVFFNILFIRILITIAFVFKLKNNQKHFKCNV